MCSRCATIAEVPPLKIVSPFSLAAEELPVFTSDPPPIVARYTSRSATPDLRHPHFDSLSLPLDFNHPFSPTSSSFSSSSRGSQRADSTAISLHLFPVYTRSLALPFDPSDSGKSRLMHFDQDPFPRAASNGRERDSFTPSLRKRVIENVPFPLKHDRIHRST